LRIFAASPAARGECKQIVSIIEHCQTIGRSDLLLQAIPSQEVKQQYSRGLVHGKHEEQAQ